MSRYPRVSFQASRITNKGTLVYTNNIAPRDVADDLMEFKCDDTDDERTESCIENKIDDRSINCSSRELFHAAMEINQLLNESKGVESWPPDSNDLTVDKARKTVPTKHFNFVSWAVGFSEEPLQYERVQISGSENCKVHGVDMSRPRICPRKRKKAMTVRQITGA